MVIGNQSQWLNRKENLMSDCTYIDVKTCELVCTVCGDRVAMPLGVVKWVVGVTELFSKTHNAAGPDHKGQLTYFQS
jgi:hypothetical protein